jgi:hypothetical protein
VIIGGDFHRCSCPYRFAPKAQAVPASQAVFVSSRKRLIDKKLRIGTGQGDQEQGEEVPKGKLPALRQ